MLLRMILTLMQMVLTLMYMILTLINVSSTRTLNSIILHSGIHLTIVNLLRCSISIWKFFHKYFCEFSRLFSVIPSIFFRFYSIIIVVIIVIILIVIIIFGTNLLYFYRHLSHERCLI